MMVLSTIYVYIMMVIMGIIVDDRLVISLFNSYRRKFRSENFRQYGQLKSRGEKSQKRQDQKKEDSDARKGRKVAIHCVFPMICGSGGSKVGSLKRRVRSQLAR